MTRKCFFVDRIDPVEDVVLLNEQTAHHAENVLRLKSGDSIELRDGSGNSWHGVIVGTRGRALEVKLSVSRPLGNESPLHLTLALAFSRSDRMDLVLRQATELGVSRFAAFRAQRSQYGLTGAQAAKRAERWLKIVREALCQCGRSVLPEISILPGVQDFIALTGAKKDTADSCVRALAWEEELGRGLMDLWRAGPTCKEAVVAVGPEGGWTTGEVEQFRRAGYLTVRLGPRVLRLETAAVGLLASVQLLWGDFGERIKEDQSHEMP